MVCIVCCSPLSFLKYFEVLLIDKQSGLHNQLFLIPGRFLKTRAFKVSQQKKSSGLRSGDLAVQFCYMFIQFHIYNLSAQDNCRLSSSNLYIHLTETSDAVLLPAKFIKEYEGLLATLASTCFSQKWAYNSIVNDSNSNVIKEVML